MRPSSMRIATSRLGVADLPSISVPQRSVVMPVADGRQLSAAGPAWAGQAEGQARQRQAEVACARIHSDLFPCATTTVRRFGRRLSLCARMQLALRLSSTVARCVATWSSAPLGPRRRRGLLRGSAGQRPARRDRVAVDAIGKHVGAVRRVARVGAGVRGNEGRAGHRSVPGSRRRTGRWHSVRRAGRSCRRGVSRARPCRHVKPPARSRWAERRRARLAKVVIHHADQAARQHGERWCERGHRGIRTDADRRAPGAAAVSGARQDDRVVRAAREARVLPHRVQRAIDGAGSEGAQDFAGPHRDRRLRRDARAHREQLRDVRRRRPRHAFVGRADDGKVAFGHRRVVGAGPSSVKKTWTTPSGVVTATLPMVCRASARIVDRDRWRPAHAAVRGTRKQRDAGVARVQAVPVAYT